MTIRPAHRRDDTETAVMAAERILPHVSELQARILEAVRRQHRQTGRGMTDGEVERLPEFAGSGYSTIRKRCSELRRLGYLEWLGDTRDGQRVSVPVPPAELARRIEAEKEGRLF